MERIAKIISRFADYGIDALLITSPENRRYASGFHSTDGIVLVTEKESFLFTDSRYIEAAEKYVKGMTVQIINSENNYKKRITSALSDCACKSVGFEDAAMSYSEYKKYSDMITLPLKPASALLNGLRRSKDESEIKLMIAAQRIAELALKDVIGIIKPGVREIDIAAELQYQMLKNGARKMSFDPIVVTGANSSMPHGVPGTEKIKNGDFVVMDFGCEYMGYCSDMTRTVAVGQVTDEMRKVYETVLRAQEAGISAAKAGVKGRDIDGAARKVISDVGYGAYFGHSFGHGIGLNIHEEPTASPTSEMVMPSGAVISAEPGIYLPGKFGVRIEDVIIIRENGCENITLAEKELIVI